MRHLRSITTIAALMIITGMPAIAEVGAHQASTTATGRSERVEKQSRTAKEAERQSKAREGIDAQALLRTLCGENSPEPACGALPDLAPDEAWLVVNEACRKTKWQHTEPCTTFRQRRGGVLIFNLKSNSWDAQWEQESYPLKFDVTGAPTLRLRPGDARPLKVLVEEISPLAYSAAPGVPKEDDLTIVAGLKSFLSLAGTGIQGLVQTITFSTAAGVSLAASKSGGADFTAKAVKPKDTTKSTSEPECEVKSPEVVPAARQVTQRVEDLVKLGTTMRAFEDALTDLEKSKSSFVRAAQQAEDGKPVTAAELVAPDLAALTKAYGDFDAATKTLATNTDLLSTCHALLNAYGTLIGAPPDGNVIHALASRVPNIAGCTATAVIPLGESLRTNAKFLASEVILNPKVCTAAKLKPIIETHRDAMKPLVDRLFNAKQVEEKVWAAIDKANAAHREVFAGAAVLARQVDRGRRHTWDNTLIRALVVTRPNPELSWNKVQSHEIVMKADSLYVKELSLSRGAEEKRPYKLESASGQLLGYGIGLIYTPLHESIYTAVARPGETTKVIAETKRETRAGDLAAFLTYRFMEHTPGKRRVQPTLDFGVGLTSDRPAFFLGMGVEILRAGRIGFGWAPQRVTTLAAGQMPNVTPVSSTDDIKTVKRFDTRNYYVSFTFALDSLSLFNSK